MPPDLDETQIPLHPTSKAVALTNNRHDGGSLLEDASLVGVQETDLLVGDEQGVRRVEPRVLVVEWLHKVMRININGRQYRIVRRTAH